MQFNRSRLALVALLACALLGPGWRGELVAVEHAELLSAARASKAARVFGISLGDPPLGERWHAQYVGRSLPVVFHDLGLRKSLPALVPPDFAAHLPAGAERADAYYRVSVALHWPWWRPGGGVDWSSAR